MINARKYITKESVNWYQVLLISFGLFGYDLISFIPAILNVSNQQILTVPYRGAFLLLSIVVLFKCKRLKTNKPNYAIGIIMLFWVLWFLRLSYDTLFNSEYIVTPLANYWLFGLGLCFIPMQAFRSEINNKTLTQTLYIAFLLCVAVNILGLNQNISNANELSVTRQGGNDFLNPITYGQNGASLAIISIILFIRNRKKGPHAFLYLLALPLGVWTLIISLSRGPLIDFVIMVVLLFAYSLKSIYARIISFMVVCFLVISLAMSFDIPVVGNLVNVLQSTGSRDNQSDEQRLQLMRGGWNQFLHSPVTGDLIEERTMHTYPHNLVIEALMACGIIAGTLHIISVSKSVIQTNKLLQNQTTRWVALLFTMQLISSMFAGGIYTDYTFWYLLVLLNTLYFQQRFPRKKQLKRPPVRGEWRGMQYTKAQLN